MGAGSSATPGRALVLVLRYRAGDLLAGPFPDLAHALFLGLLWHEFRVAEVGGDRSDAGDTFHVVDDCLGPEFSKFLGRIATGYFALALGSTCRSLRLTPYPRALLPGRTRRIRTADLYHVKVAL